ncbi:hypothetical protein ACET3Z_003290 [Daucus carota]
MDGYHRAAGGFTPEVDEGLHYAWSIPSKGRSTSYKHQFGFHLVLVKGLGCRLHARSFQLFLPRFLHATKLPLQQAESFKRDKRTQNWFQRQFSNQMSPGYDSEDGDHATAIAAATFAIYSNDESRGGYNQRINRQGPNSPSSRANTRKEDPIRFPEPGRVSRRPSSNNTRGRQVDMYLDSDHIGPPQSIRAWMKFIAAGCQVRYSFAVFSTSETEELLAIVISLYLDRQLLGLSMTLHDCTLSVLNYFQNNEWKSSCEKVALSIASSSEVQWHINFCQLASTRRFIT